ncbi:MAG: hypothetical protein Q9163_004702 [Psora crenata]
MSRVLTPQPDLFPVPMQRKRYGDKGNAQKPQGAARPPDTQVPVHGARKQGEARSESASHEIVAREHAGGVFRVGVAEIVEHRIEEEEGADGEPARADDGHDPMERGPSRPAEPE